MAIELPLAVILAGGLGTRLRSVVPHIPKALAPIHGAPFLLYQLRWLQMNRVNRVILCVGYRGNHITRQLGDGSRFGMHIRYSHEEKPLGTAGALAQAAPLLPAEFLLLNGDTYTEMPLSPLWQAHKRHKALVTMAVTEAPDAREAGAVTLADDMGVTVFKEKEPGQSLVSMGIYASSKNLLAWIPPHRPCSLEKEVFPHIHHLYGYMSDYPFIDIGTPAGYCKAQAHLLKRPRPFPEKALKGAKP